MAVCTKCGTESEGQFCTNCGASLTTPAQNSAAPPQNVPSPSQNYQNPAQNYQNAPPRYQNPAPNYQTPPPFYNNVSVIQPNTATSPGGWIGWMLLMSFLPIIAQLIMLSSHDESVRNFAKAQLYIMLICVVLAILAVVGIIILGAIGSSM